jgi:hypothetical protein
MVFAAKVISFKSNLLKLNLLLTCVILDSGENNILAPESNPRP